MKLTFHRGASIADPKKLFNSSLEGNVRRAIDLREGEKINEAAFRQLIRAAVDAATPPSALNAISEEVTVSQRHDVSEGSLSIR